jgi:hypothetical protein
MLNRFIHPCIVLSQTASSQRLAVRQPVLPANRTKSPVKGVLEGGRPGGVGGSTAVGATPCRVKEPAAQEAQKPFGDRQDVSGWDA